jgi:hypothetical protein
LGYVSGAETLWIRGEALIRPIGNSTNWDRSSKCPGQDSVIALEDGSTRGQVISEAEEREGKKEEGTR